MISRFGGAGGEIGSSSSSSGGGEGFSSPSTTLKDERKTARNTDQELGEKKSRNFREEMITLVALLLYLGLKRKDWRVVWQPDDRNLLG